jgi:hypothetical protein
VFALSGTEVEEEDGNSYVIPCFFKKSRMSWISCGVYGRVRLSLGYCQILISQIGLSGGPSSHLFSTAWHHINSMNIVVNSCCFLAPRAARKQKTVYLASGGRLIFPTGECFVTRTRESHPPKLSSQRRHRSVFVARLPCPVSRTAPDADLLFSPLSRESQ